MAQHDILRSRLRKFEGSLSEREMLHSPAFIKFMREEQAKQLRGLKSQFGRRLETDKLMRRFRKEKTGSLRSTTKPGR